MTKDKRNFEKMNNDFSMEKRLLFSIIMAAYNAEKYIRYAINSVLEQTYENWELIIVNDGSSDATGHIADEYVQLDKRITAIHQKNSGTAASARNTALNYVRGDYVQILDSDDLLSRDCLKKYSDALARRDYTRISIISPISILVDSQGVNIKEVAQVSRYIDRRISGVEAFELSLDWKIHGWFAVSKDLILKIKYDEKLINGDEFTTRKLFVNSNEVLFTSACYFYRENENSTTRSNENKVRMYETIETDKNIFNYVLKNTVSKKIVEKSFKKYCKSIMSHEAQYQRNIQRYSRQDQEIISSIIIRNYEYAYRTMTESDYVMGIWKVIYFLSLGKYRIFSMLCNAYNFFWTIRQALPSRK